MIRTRRTTLAIVIGAAGTVGALFAGPAEAAQPAPPPASTVQTFCPFTGTQREPDGSLLFGVEANGAGCVVVRTIPEGVALDQVIVAPGWIWTFSGGGGSRHGQGAISGKVDIKFTQTSTQDKVEVRVEPGKTEVK